MPLLAPLRHAEASKAQDVCLSVYTGTDLPAVRMTRLTQSGHTRTHQEGAWAVTTTSESAFAAWEGFGLRAKNVTQRARRVKTKLIQTMYLMISFIGTIERLPDYSFYIELDGNVF
jgi:hypothetical protein